MRLVKEEWQITGNFTEVIRGEKAVNAAVQEAQMPCFSEF
jgi:hypothetical protein